MWQRRMEPRALRSDHPGLPQPAPVLCRAHSAGGRLRRGSRRQAAESRLAWLDTVLADREFIAGPRYDRRHHRAVRRVDFGRVGKHPHSARADPSGALACGGLSSAQRKGVARHQRLPCGGRAGEDAASTVTAQWKRRLARIQEWRRASRPPALAPRLLFCQARPLDCWLGRSGPHNAYCTQLPQSVSAIAESRRPALCRPCGTTDCCGKFAPCDRGRRDLARSMIEPQRRGSSSLPQCFCSRRWCGRSSPPSNGAFVCACGRATRHRACCPWLCSHARRPFSPSPSPSA